jgi:hypothetical protein
MVPTKEEWVAILLYSQIFRANVNCVKFSMSATDKKIIALDMDVGVYQRLPFDGL